jgi:hypothetical protein
MVVVQGTITQDCQNAGPLTLEQGFPPSYPPAGHPLHTASVTIPAIARRGVGQDEATRHGEPELVGVLGCAIEARGGGQEPLLPQLAAPEETLAGEDQRHESCPAIKLGSNLAIVPCTILARFPLGDHSSWEMSWMVENQVRNVHAAPAKGSPPATRAVLGSRRPIHSLHPAGALRCYVLSDRCCSFQDLGRETQAAALWAFLAPPRPCSSAPRNPARANTCF